MNVHENTVVITMMNIYENTVVITDEHTRKYRGYY